VAQRLALDAILVDPEEMQVIGENDVLRQALVPSDLIGLQDVIKIFPDVFVFNVPKDQSGSGNLEIRSALADYPLWFVLDSGPIWGRVGECL
jgi:hypothetical protein